MKTKYFTLLFLLIALLGFGQQNYWTKTERIAYNEIRERRAQPAVFSLYRVDLPKIKEALAMAPQRFSANESTVVKFPDADGHFRNYVIQESPVMEPELQAKFPQIRTYTGWQKDNTGNTIQICVTPENGISIMYFDGWDLSYLDSYTKDNSSFILYKRSDLAKNNRLFECQVEDLLKHSDNPSTMKAPLVSDGQMRTYRLALAATREYTAFHGGTVAGAMAAMATTMTRVNGVFEKTVSTRMVMVANNNLVVYTAEPDPYTNNDGFAMLNQNQSTLDGIIGSFNYDIGHVFSTGGGGVAALGSVCAPSAKGRGVTGSPAPVGDPFDIDYVAHEMGHQFGANHTFRANTGACAGNANNATAYEPGSGSTIMGYAGICGSSNNVQSNSDAYFHAASVVEMYTFVSSLSASCAVVTANNNLVPVANAGADYIIPRSTAFALTGTGSDPNSDPITYLWEQYDNQNNIQPPVSTATTGPVYRSFIPTVSPTRYFPRMASILANNLTPTWEVTPSVARTLNFSLLVNDNKATGNQAARDAMVVTVTNDGPFTVTSHTANIPYNAAVPTAVTWNVAGTNAGAINTQTVSILLTKDGGINWQVLASNVPNNGLALVTLPNEDIASARIMVKADGNIYFAVNPSYFSIQSFLSTAENEVKSFVIYPNPAKDELNIRLSSPSESGTYKMYDASGKLVKEGKLRGEAKIRLDALVSGNYVLSVELSSGKRHTEKIIVTK